MMFCKLPLPLDRLKVEDSGRTTDASGSKLHANIELFLKDRIIAHFKEKQIELNLGRHAVHAGKSGMVVARRH
jgi:hypothetical protein